MRLLTTLLLLLGLFSFGCAAKATRVQLMKRASFDLNCPQNQLNVVEIDKRTIGVRGCEKQATYLESCEMGANEYGSYRKNCTWVMNNDGRAAN